MKDVTRVMIDIWKLDNFDWMGYKISKNNKISFHHLIVPKRSGGKYEVRNGALLVQNSSHEYLHVIEHNDRDRFYYLTEVLREVNLQEYMTTYEQYKRIDDCLKGFEREYCGTYTRKGNELIKDIYTRRIM